MTDNERLVQALLTLSKQQTFNGKTARRRFMQAANAIKELTETHKRDMAENFFLRRRLEWLEVEHDVQI